MGVKKETTGGTQSAAERPAAEALLHNLIERFAPAHLRLIGELRERLGERLPTAYELVYEYREWFVISYSPSEHGYEGVLAIHASADGVKLYLNRGKELPDPAKLLHGSGKLVRWIGVLDASTLARPEVERLIEEAIARNPVPFASEGCGSLVIRPAPAK